MPPVALTYHFRFCPVAAIGAATSSLQYLIGVVTNGGAGFAFTVTVIASGALGQPLIPD